jgi:hypothetical protein
MKKNVFAGATKAMKSSFECIRSDVPVRHLSEHDGKYSNLTY